MPLIQPFAGLRPAPGRAADLIAPPYDVVSLDEARALVDGRPWHFLRIGRAEVELPPDADPHASAVYARARGNLDRMRQQGVLIQDATPCFYIYQMLQGAHVQTGLAALASVAAYRAGRIKRHELTRPAKEDDRVRHIETLRAQTGPVLLAYRANAELDGLLASHLHTTAPESEATATDGVVHRLWPLTDPRTIDEIAAAVEGLPALYIADGHHRCAAAVRVAAGAGAQETAGFLAVLFPHEQMRILDYNRVVAHLNGFRPDSLLAAIARQLGETPEPQVNAQAARPRQRGEVALFVGRRWYRLRLAEPAASAPDAAIDPVARLDVSRLQDQIIEPLLGIKDPRRDPRIDFVGGNRGLDALAERVRGGSMAAAFALYPTAMDELMAVADTDRLMPPKSTWFEPKLADGLVSHLL